SARTIGVARAPIVDALDDGRVVQLRGRRDAAPIGARFAIRIGLAWPARIPTVDRGNRHARARVTWWRRWRRMRRAARDDESENDQAAHASLIALVVLRNTLGIAVGIDLGTTNTVVAAVQKGRVATLPDEFGRRLLPSIVSFHPMGQVLVGDPAKDRRLNDPRNTIWSVKRLLGRRWSSPEVQRLKSQLPFELVEGLRESVSVVARGETYALPEISAFVLKRAKEIATRALGDEVTSAVITVPANFNDLQRASTKVAGQLAELEVLRIMNEPTAAALAYGQQLKGAGRIAVYDFGGGTFDLSLLDLSTNVYEVLMTKGDTALGGDDIDAAIAERMSNHVMRTLNINTDPLEIRGRLRLYAEQIKIALSEKTEAEIVLSGLGFGPGGKELETTFAMKRTDLEHLAAPF